MPGNPDDVKLELLLAELGESEHVEGVRARWEESVASLPLGGPDFLKHDNWREYRAWCGLGDDADPKLAEAARRITESPALTLLAWHAHRRLVDFPENVRTDWPLFQKSLGELRGAFYLLIGLSIVPRVQAVHKAMSVPEQITRDTCSQLRSMCGNWQKGHGGKHGLWLRQLYWLRHYVDGRLFRLGRLEYYLAPMGEMGCSVFRNTETDEILALAEDGVSFNADGLPPSKEGAKSGDGCWTSSLTADGATVTGHPISPYGRALARAVTLPTPPWKRVLAKEDTVLSMHIPSGGGLTPEKFIASMQQAYEFFAKYFPDRPPRAVVSGSWMFSHLLEDILPPTTNLVRNVKELYLTPDGVGRGSLWFVFCQEGVLDPDKVPATTTLERAVVDFLRSGGVWRNCYMFILKEDLQHFGTQYYRSHWPPAVVATQAQ